MAEAPSGQTEQSFERHFTAKELAEQWHLAELTVFKMCEFEPGVIKIGKRSSRKRARVSIRIPFSVARRVYEKITLR